MALTVEQTQGKVLVTVLAIQGDLDYSNYRDVIERVQELFGGGCRHLLIDLSEVPFIASSGLVALHSAIQIMDGQRPPDTESGWQALHDLASGVSGVQANVKLVGLRPRVEQMLQRTALLRYFETFEDRAAAIDSF